MGYKICCTWNDYTCCLEFLRVLIFMTNQVGISSIYLGWMKLSSGYVVRHSIWIVILLSSQLKYLSDHKPKWFEFVATSSNKFRVSYSFIHRKFKRFHNFKSSYSITLVEPVFKAKQLTCHCKNILFLPFPTIWNTASIELALNCQILFRGFCRRRLIQITLTLQSSGQCYNLA